MQKFLRGEVHVECNGTLTSNAVTQDKESSHFSIIEVADETTHGVWPASVQHHVCFVVPRSSSARERPSVFAETTSTTLETAVHTELPGAFQLVSRFEGVGTRALRLHGRVPFDGPVTVYLGEYAGPEHYNTAIMQAAGAAKIISVAWRALMAEHSENPEASRFPVSMWDGVEPDYIENCLSRPNLPRYILSREQRNVVTSLQANRSACQGIRAVAGSGKQC